MAGSINEATILGNLGKDPEIRSTQDGREIANLTIATSESWKDRNTGERKEVVEWHRISIFNEALAGIAKQYLRKGSKVLVRGAIKTRKWTDQGGQERYSTEIVLQGFDAKLVLLDGKRDEQPDGGRGGYESARPQRAAPQQDYLDDEIPF